MPSVAICCSTQRAGLVEDAVVVERLRDQAAAGHELDQRRAGCWPALRSTRAHVDRVDAEDDA